MGGRLRAVHVLGSAPEAQIEALDAEAAVEAILSRACAPIHAPELTEKILATVSSLVSCVPVTRLSLPRERPVMPFAWGSAETTLGFAMPEPS